MLTWLGYFERFGKNFLRGAGVTLELTAVGLAIGFVLGFAAGAGAQLWSQMAAAVGWRLHRDLPRHATAGAACSSSIMACLN